MIKRNKRKLALAVLIALSMLIVITLPTFATGKGLTQCVTVTQTVSGSPTKTDYTYYLMPMEKGNPMPSEEDGGKLEDGLYKFPLKGNDTAKFNLTFTAPGTYNYELRRTEAAPEGDTVTPTIHPFGYKVKEAADGTFEIIPFTCYDVYMEIVDKDGKPLEIVLTNKLEKPEPTTDKGNPGKDGTNGTNGKNGADGTNGTNGRNGTNGTNGTSTIKTITQTVGKAINTGDPNHILLWGGLVLVSAGALIAILIVRRKKEKDNESS